MVSFERLRELFDYRADGNLVRKIALSRSSKIGEPIGFSDTLGYRYASIGSKTYPLHRLIWAWHGLESAEELDHINRIRDDNRIENLRAANCNQNRWNKGIQSNNTTGVKGVCWKKDMNAYCVRIGVNKKRLHVGYFDDLELAELVAAEAREKYHGAFAHY